MTAKREGRGGGILWKRRGSFLGQYKHTKKKLEFFSQEAEGKEGF